MVNPEMAAEFNPEKIESEIPKEKLPVTVWIDADVKRKYDEIQERYRKKYCRHLASVISLSILKTFDREIGK